MSPLIPTHDAFNSSSLVPAAEETLHWLVARTNTVPNTFRQFSRSQPRGPCTDKAERNTIITGCVMILITLIAWNLPVLRDIIAGLKVSLDSA